MTLVFQNWHACQSVLIAYNMYLRVRTICQTPAVWPKPFLWNLTKQVFIALPLKTFVSLYYTGNKGFFSISENKVDVLLVKMQEESCEIKQETSIGRYNKKKRLFEEVACFLFMTLKWLNKSYYTEYIMFSNLAGYWLGAQHPWSVQTSS